MTVQILVSTMNQKDHQLVKKMNLFSDAIVINQCEKTGKDVFFYKGHRIEWYDCNERGIGLSRNTALMRSKADICVFADDDMVYNSNSLDNVISAFNRNPKADLIIFNIDSPKAYKNTKTIRLHTWNAYKYGTVRIAVKRESVENKRICFSLLFGGGAKYSCGEDTLFLRDCLNRKLRLFAVPEILGDNIEGKSTWFTGFNKKFFVDKGILYLAMNSWLAPLYCIKYVLQHGKAFKHEASRLQALLWMLNRT